jgi:hypothetical protein
MQDTRKAALAKAVAELHAFKPCPIDRHPNAEDAEALESDLRALCRIFDPLIEAYGIEAKSHWPDVDITLFEDQCFAALDGNAIFEIVNVAEREDDNARDLAADTVAEMQREFR